MRLGPGLAFVFLSSVVLAGCIGDGGADEPAADDDGSSAADVAADCQRGRTTLDHDAIARCIGEPIEVDHDHRHTPDHVGGYNLDFVAWSPLDIELGRNGFANFVYFFDDDESLAFVAIDGDETGGFAIVDISDPTDLRTLGHYWIEGNNIQEVRVFPGGDYALMNVQKIPNQNNTERQPTGKDCTVCLQIVDVSDRTDPVFANSYPVDLLGSHNMDIVVIDDETYVFYVGQPVQNAPPGNYVGIARFVDGPARPEMVKVTEYRHSGAYTDEKRSFPHDVLVQEHPVTGQWIAYVSHWEGGAIAVDVSNPAAPVELGKWSDPAPSELSNIHWMQQEPTARGDGRVIVWSAPEIGQLFSGSGLIRSYDATDPANLTQIGWWDLPGPVTINSSYIFSPHTTDVDADRGLLAVSHYHAGVWILDPTDPTDPRSLGFYVPVGDPDAIYEGPIWWKKPNFNPEGYTPNVYMVRWHPDNDLLFVSERGTGLYVLEYTGPEPGPLA